MGRDHALGRVVAWLLLRWQSRRGRGREPARWLLPAPVVRHGHRDLRGSRSQPAGRDDCPRTVARGAVPRRPYRQGSRRHPRRLATRSSMSRLRSLVSPPLAPRWSGRACCAPLRRSAYHVLAHPGRSSSSGSESEARSDQSWRDACAARGWRWAGARSSCARRSPGRLTPRLRLCLLGPSTRPSPPT